jgi:hypothetical protein
MFFNIDVYVLASISPRRTKVQDFYEDNEPDARGQSNSATVKTVRRSTDSAVQPAIPESSATHKNAKIDVLSDRGSKYSCAEECIRVTPRELKPSEAEYFASLSGELDSQAQRVRQLIGGAHWGHDGRHKELLLAELIRRYCPSSVLVSTGFVISPNNLEIRSSEQDILIVDASREAPLFHQGQLVVAFAHTVVAAVSVKTTMESASLKETIDGLQTVRRVVRDAGLKAEQTWCGGFFYRVQESWSKNSQLIYNNVKRCILKNPAPAPILHDDKPHIIGPNCISDSSELALIFDYERIGNKNTARLRGYSCPGVATAIFLSAILEHIAINFGATHSPFTDLVANLGLPNLSPSTFGIVN